MDNLISRQAAIKAIDDLPNCYNGYSDTYDKAYIIGVLEELPTIEPKHGKWIEMQDDVFASTYKCSKCGCWPLTEYDRWALTDYCPNCGAKMERSEE